MENECPLCAAYSYGGNICDDCVQNDSINGQSLVDMVSKGYTFSDDDEEEEGED
jgi:hypothetical protein